MNKAGKRLINIRTAEEVRQKLFSEMLLATEKEQNVQTCF